MPLARYALYLSSEADAIWLPMPTLVLIPVAILTILWRDDALLELLDQRAAAEEEWMQVLNDVGRNWQLVNSYNLRNERLAMFKSCHAAFTKLDKKAKLHRISTTWVIRLSSEVLVALTFLIGAWQARPHTRTPRSAPRGAPHGAHRMGHHSAHSAQRTVHSTHSALVGAWAGQLWGAFGGRLRLARVRHAADRPDCGGGVGPRGGDAAGHGGAA